ncbi:MAG: glycine cleavage system aminomethyltransferase GcvT [Steroidobacteraceae bacterium]
MGKKTPLFELHKRLGARIVDFGGWDMPVAYGSQIEEHHSVRRTAGIFDVSHMCSVDLRGRAPRALLQKLLANDVGRLKEAGRALYSCMLNEAGGVIDDLIVYFIDESFFRAVVNAGTRDKDIAWLRRHAGDFGVEVIERSDLAMVAVQGPAARARVAGLLPEAAARAALALPSFSALQLGEYFVARTGYTGEDGVEIALPSELVEWFWVALNAAAVRSCGLGARDTLRLEAGLNLYGSDMDETTHPYESGLGWTVHLEARERDFIGRAALERVLAQGSARQQVGLLLEDPGVLRAHQELTLAGSSDGGEITSGSFAPTLERSVALARVPAGTWQEVRVDLRGRPARARVVRPPFVKRGKILIPDLAGAST